MRYWVYTHLHHSVSHTRTNSLLVPVGGQIQTYIPEFCYCRIWSCSFLRRFSNIIMKSHFHSASPYWKRQNMVRNTTVQLEVLFQPIFLDLMVYVPRRQACGSQKAVWCPVNDFPISLWITRRIWNVDQVAHGRFLDSKYAPNYKQKCHIM
jgi:hypothetical protein